MSLGFATFIIWKEIWKITSDKSHKMKEIKSCRKLTFSFHFIIIVLEGKLYIYMGQNYHLPWQTEWSCTVVGHLYQGFPFFFINVNNVPSFTYSSPCFFRTFYAITNYITLMFENINTPSALSFFLLQTAVKWYWLNVQVL